MADGCVFIPCETLCYVQNYFWKFPKSNLLQTIVNFYKEEEIAAAKCQLFEFIESLTVKPDSLPRHIKRQGDNKRNADGDDILKLFAALDAASVQLPKFVAVDLTRVPTVTPGDVDVYTLAANMENIQRQMTSVLSRLSEVEARPCPSSTQVDVNAVSWPALSSRIVGASTAGNQMSTGTHDTPESETRWSSDGAAGGSGGAIVHQHNAEPEWQLVESPAKKKREGRLAHIRQQAPVRVKGARGTGDAVTLKAVPRREVLAAYVGRLHPETTAAELVEYLTKEGIRGVNCKKLVAKDGKKFATAAFYVTCCPESSELFYSDQCWPEGVELRDWVYYNKQKINK